MNGIEKGGLTYALLTAKAMAATIHTIKKKKIPRQILAVRLRMPKLLLQARHS
jgi:hypothetical protein